MKQYLVTTTSQKRQCHWLHLFGLDELPIRQAVPAVKSHPYKPTPILAYTLDVVALHPMARSRFAHYVARRYGLTYDEAFVEIIGWLIEATADCRVMVDLSKEGERPLSGFFMPGGRYCRANLLYT
jgi:hypothetical protein